MTFSFSPRSVSVLPLIAASIRNSLVSWNDDPEMKLSVGSEAFVIPMRRVACSRRQGASVDLGALARRRRIGHPLRVTRSRPSRAAWLLAAGAGLLGGEALVACLGDPPAVAARDDADANANAEAGAAARDGETDGEGPESDAPEGGGADADAAADGPCPCPGSAPCGIALVTGPTSRYCVDPHEVTEAAFAAFVAQNLGATIDAGAPCPALSILDRASGSPTRPVRSVSFCEARAYCTWAGKRLCGGLDGGVLTLETLHDVDTNGWLRACTGGTGTSVVVGGECRKARLEDAGPAASGTTCEGGFSGLFDMHGNVWEWLDAPYVSGSAPSAYFMGSGWDSPATDDCRTSSGVPITDRRYNIGFRCCSVVF
jgi:formylglycine-generating enzyme required for sulfatase activity